MTTSDHYEREATGERQLPRAEEQFRSFLSDSIKFVATIASTIPLLADYFESLKAPYPGHSLAIVTSGGCGLIFLTLFWHREMLTSVRWVIVGIIAFFGGGALLLRVGELSGNAPETLRGAFYFLGFPLALGGAALVVINGFARIQERQDTLWRIVPRLDDGQWRSLLRFARGQVAMRESVAKLTSDPQARIAIKKGTEQLLRMYNEMLVKLSAGTLEIHGPAMYEIYAQFMDGVRKRFRALSRDDMGYWAGEGSEDPTQYLRANEELIKRKCAVERIFLIYRRKLPLTDAHVDAIRRQIGMGVVVKIAFVERTDGVVVDNRELDFGLFDDFAVSFWRFTSGRVFKITTSREERERFQDIYSRVAGRCEEVPGKAGDMRGVFENTGELDRWITSQHR